MERRTGCLRRSRTRGGRSRSCGHGPATLLPPERLDEPIERVCLTGPANDAAFDVSDGSSHLFDDAGQVVMSVVPTSDVETWPRKGTPLPSVKGAETPRRSTTSRRVRCGDV